SPPPFPAKSITYPTAPSSAAPTAPAILHGRLLNPLTSAGIRLLTEPLLVCRPAYSFTGCSLSEFENNPPPPIPAIIRPSQVYPEATGSDGQVGRQSRCAGCLYRRPAGAPDRQRVRPRTPRPAKGYHRHEGNASQPPLWGNGRARAQDH